MPTIQNTTRGQVVQIWGKAYIRGTDGVWRPLTVGEVVPQGAEILTEQDAIVMMTRGDVAVPKVAAESPVERAIIAVDKGEEAPAAGLQGGGSGDLQPGLRVDRIVELVTPATIDTRLDSTAVEFGRATQSDPGAKAPDAPGLIVGSSSISSVEAGGSVGLGLRAPSGSGTLTITVTQLPTIGEVVTADGTPVALGAVLSAEQLTGLIYLPPADYSAGTPVGNFGYSVTNGIETADGGTRIAVTPVNDLPVAIDGSNSGGEDMLLDVSLNGTDIDGTIANVTVRTLPANGTLLLTDTLAPVTAGQVLTPAQAASLVFRPAANWNGSTAFTFTVTDNEGGVSAPATVRLTVTPANDPPVAVNDTSSTVAQAPVTVAVLANDSDIDNDPLTVTGASVPATQGTVVVNADGTLTFTAAAGVTGPVVISYSISDGNGGTANATFTVNVAATPTVTVDAPALTNDRTPTLTGTSNLPPGSTVTLTVTDALGAVQTFTTIVRADGTYSADVPANLAEGPYTAVANVNGPGGTTASANDNGVVDVTPPVITVDAPSLTNDSTPALTGTTDLPAGSTITLAVTGANGVTQLFTTTVLAGGVFNVDVPAALVSGPFTVSARGTDAAGNTATATDNGVVDTVPPTITVDAPALTNDTTPQLTGTTDLAVGTTVTLTVTGANGAVQTFTTTVQTGGVFTVDVPAALVEGNFTAVASGTDAAGNTATATDSGVIDITPPTVTVDAPALTNDTTPTLTGTTNLPVGATVTLVVTGANGAVQTFSATVQTGGVFSVDVPAALVQGTFNVVATATDAAGNSATAADSGLIDTTPPVASLTIDPVTADNIVNAGEATGNITITGTVGGDVRVGDTVTLNVNGVAYTGLVLAGNTFAISVPGSAVLADADRRIDGSVTTTDAANNSVTASAQRPYSVNTAPIAVNDTLSIGEDTASAGSDVTPGTPAQDRDADGDTLTVVGVVTGVQPSAAGNVNTPLAGTWGTLLLDGFGAYTYAPSAAAQALDPGQTVSDTFTYTIEDGRGGSATATLTISVVGANDPTTISGVFIGAVSEDAVATASGTLSNNDPDVGTRPFVEQSNSAGTYGTFSIDSTGTWTYTLTNAAANVQALAQGQSVTETFIVATDDGTTASITVTVNGANDAPVVSSTAINAVEEGAAVGLGLSVPSDIDNASVLLITVSGLPTIGQVQLANGTAVANGDVLSATQLTGLRYLPPADYSGAPVGSFAYTVSDGIATVNGGTTITVSAVNDPPQAFNDARTTGENSALSTNVPTATDVDGTINSYTLASGVGAGNGSLAFNADGSYVFNTGTAFDNLAAGQSRTVSFTYTATDNLGAASAPATVTITVTGANDAPTGSDGTYTIAEDGSRAFAGADFGFADVDVGDTLTRVRIDSLPAAGTLALNGVAVTAGQSIDAADLVNLVFTPAANANGAPYASFTFSVQDSGGLFDAAPNTISFNVTPVNDPPVAVVTPATGDEDTPVSVSLTGTDIDGTIASVRVTVLPTNGVLYLADGITPVVANTPLTPAQAASLVFVPAANFNGSVSVTFTVTDNSGATSAPAVTPITVAPVVDPTISIDDVSVNEAAGTITFTVSLDQPTTATVSVNYTSANGTATSPADYAAVNGTLTFAPGVTTQTVTVNISDDAVFEGNENFNVLLSGAVNATIADNSGLGTITDNDAPTLAVSSPTVGEGGFAVFTVSLSNASTTAVTFNPTLALGTATVGTDTSTALEYFNGSTWVAVPVGGVTLAASTTSVQVRVATTDDFAAEGNEQFTLTATVTAGTTTNASATGTATINDDSDATTLTLAATPSVAEGGVIVYTATLDHAAVTPLAVTLSTGQTINIAAGAISGSVSIAAPGEDPYLDASSVSRSIASTTGGGFESLTVDTTTVTTTVTDTIDTTTVSITGDAVVAEGATAAYTVSLTSPAQTAVTITLAYSGVAANGADFTGIATVTIPAGASSAALNIATLQDVLAEGAESFTVTIGSAAGGNFENLVISSANGAATTSITDDDTPTIAVSSPTIGEGGFAVFTVSLSNPSTTAVTFNPALASGTATVGTDTATALEYFNGTTWVAVPVGGVTIAAGSTSVQVRVATTDDVAAEGSEQFTLTATVSSGNTGNASATGTATISDDSDATTVSLTATPSVAEGGQITYTAALTNAAVTAMTVTLSNGAVINIAAGATSGSTPVAAPTDDVYIDAGSVSATVATTGGGSFEAVTINPAAATTAVTDTIDTTTATLTATPSVAEGGTITYTVSLTAPVTGSAVTVTLAGGQTITIPVGASSGTASGVAPDNVYAGGNSVSNSIVSASGGNFEQLTPNAAPVTTTVTDDGDVTTVSLAATPSVVEGGNISYTATLTFAAQTPVSVTLSNGAVITIAAGATSGTVSVAAPGDDPYVDASTVSATIATATGGNFESLQIDPAAASTTVTDDVDPTTVSLSATASVAEGGSIVYTATLTNAAQTPVTVTLSTGETITIAAGATTGSVSIAAPSEDVYVDAGSVSRTITSATGGNFESLTVNPAAATTTVSDTINATTVSITGDATVAEGATAAYVVSLTSPAQTAVTVNLSYSGVAANGADFTGVATVTIPAGASSAALNIATLQDVLAEGAESFTVTLGSASGGNFESLVISGTNGAATTSITDDDTPALSVSSPTVGEGSFAVFTVSLSNASTTAVTFNPALTSGTATIGTDTATSLEYFNGTAWVAVPVGGVTLAAGATSVQVRVATSDDFAAEGNEQFTLTATVTAGTTANASATGTATITDDVDTTTVTLAATPTIAEGGSITYTATLDHAAVTPMTVTLSSGQTITIAAGATTGTVAIAAPGDDPYLDAGSVSRTIASTSGGGLEAVTINPAAATTAITDTIDTTTATLTATPSVAEGGTITWTVSLGAPVTGSAVTVTLAGGQTITIPVGSSSGTATAVAADNGYAGGGSVSNNIASIGGGNFEQLTPNTAPVTTTVTDDADVTTVSLTATASVVEGGNITYTATLTNAAQTPVSVTLANGAIITIAAGATTGTAIVAAPSDDPYIDAATVSTTIATATGGNFESLQIDPAAASTSVTDDVDPTTVSLSATASVAEGGSIVYTATLTNAAQTPVTVTLSGGETIGIAAGSTTGSVTLAAPSEDVYIDASSVSRTIASAAGGNFESLAVNPAAATTSVTDTINATTVSITGDASVAEGATAAYTVSLTSPAQTAVTVNLAYSGTAANGTDFTGVATVTIPAGSSSASFSIATLQDVLAEGSENFTVTIGSAAGGNFESLVISGTNGAQTTQIIDDDTPTLSVSSPTVGEGDFAVFTVSLSNASTTAVTFNPTLASATASVGTDTGTALQYFNGTAWVAVPVGGVTIAAGSTSVQVRVATTDDFAAEGNETFNLTATVTAGTTANASATGTATITDDTDATTVTLTATPSVAEGGSITYTATLANAAFAPMTVTLSNGATITIAAGATIGSTPVAAPSDDVYIDAGSVSATIASTSGGGFEAVTINPAAATTAITDTIDTTTATLTATPSVAEGGTITYTVSLTAPVTGSAVSVTLANGQTVSIAVGASSGSVTTAVADNVYAGGGSVSNSIASISGGNFEQLTPNTAPVTTTVTDDGDVTTVSLSATASVVEGGSITYTATLTNAAQTAVSVTLSNGATITIAAGATSGTAVVAAPGDDPYVDASTVSATISTATGGNFESLQIDPAAANTSVTDDVDATTVSLSATAGVAEGGSIVYTATLTNAAQTATTVTLSTGQTITIAAGATTGSVSIAAPSEDVYVDAGSVSRTITSATGGNFESLAVNPAAATTTVSDTIDSTTVSITGSAVVAEGATAAYTVSLTSAAQTAVTVNLTYSGTAANGADFTGVATVTIPAGSSSANFNIATLQDVLAEGAESFTVTIGSAAGGNFENLAISGTNGAATTSISDDDTPTIAVSSPTVGEGGFAVFTVSLSNPSTTAVVFTPSLASGSATVGTDTSTALEYFNGTAWVAVPVGGISISAGATSIQVRVATTDDVAAEGSEQFTLTATVSSGNTGNATATGTATITDDADVTTVSLSATPSVAEGGQITYTATLTSAAVTPLTVTLSSGQTIAIAAGATTGTVSIAAPSDDPYIDAGSVSRTIASTSGGGFESLSINGTAAATTVTDTIDTTTATLTATPSVAEGGTITYTVSLAAAVTGSAVNVLLANGQTVTIPVGASSASVTSTAPDNVYGGGASVANNIVSASGGNYEQLTPNTAPVTTTVTDDGDVTTVSLTATASVVEGTSITYTATLTNAAQTAVTVTLSNGATITIAAGATTGTAVVAAPGDDPYIDASTVSATIATATGGNFESLQINPAAANTTVTDDSDPTTLNLSATASVAEGGSIVYTATLTNAAQTPLTVTLTGGTTITIAAGATSGSVSIAAPTEDVYLDAGSVSRSITATSGGNFENLQIGTASATTTVTDTIDATTVSITGSGTVAEGATASYTVSLTSPAQTAVTVNLTYTGTAANGSDYTGVASVTIAAGASSAAFNIATLQDVIGEGAENFTVTIASASGGNFESLVISGANGAQTTTITDDDTPTIAVSSPTVGEGGLAVFTISLSNAATTAVTFNPTLSSGTATVGADTATALEYFNGTAWVAVPVGGVTIAAGSTSVQVRVATNDDVAAEGNETFSLTATVTAGSTANASAVGTATITDDADATTVTLTATPSVAEGGTIVYTATLSNAAVTPLTVTLSTGQTITVAAGATIGTVSIAAPTEDPYVDASTVSRTIASTSGGGFESLTVNPAAATTSVTDTIDTTTLSISGSATIAEGAAGTYTVSLTNPAQTAVTVNLTYTGTAANGADYTGVATVTIAAGASSATFNIATIDDNIDEVAAESFTVTVASATGGNFENLVVSGTNNSVTTAITDNDAAPAIAVSSQSVAEAGGFAVFTVSLSNPSSTATTVSLVLADGTATGADYGASLEVSTNGGTTWTTASSATFAAGATSLLVRTPITSDVLDETDETFTLTATRTAGTTSNTSAVGTTTITDDDATPSLVINDVTVNETAGTATFTVTLSAASGQTVSVNVATSNGSATAGGDYTAVPSTTLTFTPGTLTQTITVPILDDGTYEGPETFNVLLSGAVNATIADPSGLGTINDNDLPALSVNSPTVTEGGFAVFTVSLSNPSTTAVTFNPALASGTATVGTDTSTALEYFNGTAWVAVPIGGVTIAAGSTSVQVRVATTDDFAAEGDETFTLTATRTAGSTSNASAVGTATITDDSDTTTVSLTATPSVVEGGNITYTATLTSAAITPLTVNLSGGGVITIAAGATTGTLTIAAPTDDPYIDAGPVSRTIASTSGGGFEALAIDTTAAVTNVTDDVDATTVSLSATPSVAEGGTIVYTATLTNAAQTAVTVTLSTGQTIAIAAGATTGTVSILSPTDDPYIDAGSVSRTITSAAGGNFESLVVNPAAATTTVSDTIDTTTATLTATPSVAEGGTITYTVSLTAAVTGSAVTVTLAGGQTITIPVGASSGTTTATAPDNAYAGGGSVTNNIATISGGNFEQLTPNTAVVTTTVTDDADVTTVTLTATASVVEGGNITYTATLTNAAQTAVTVTLSTGQTITIAAGATTGTVSIAAPGDDVYIDASTVSRTISTATGGGFESLAINPAAANTNVTDDSDATTLTLSATASVVEGGNITYTATLTNAAQTAVTVTLSGGEVITIAAGATVGTATVTAPSDDVYIDASTVTRTISTATGGNFELLTINPAAASTTVTDDSDATTVTLTATPSVVEGGTIVYTATLTSAAQTAVTVNLSGGGVITIAAGATSGTLNVAAPSDDVYVDASTVSRTITSATGGNFESLVVNPAAATTTITDDSDATTVTLTATPSVAEGGSIVYTATLTNAAQTAVTVNLSGGGAITIAAGATTGTLTVAAPSEDMYVDAGTVSRTITSAAGGNFESLVVNPAAATTAVTDTLDTTTLSISGSATVAEGASGTYTVSLTSPAQTAVTVNLTYAGTAANGADYTGVATVTIAAGASSATFNIATIDDNIDEVAAESFTVTVASATGGNFENLVISGANNSVTTAITDNDNPPGISIGDVSVNEADGTMTFTVSLSAASGLPISVAYATGGGTATAVSDYTAASGTLNFAAGVTSQTITVTIANDTVAEPGETLYVNLSTPTNASIADGLGIGTIIDNDATPTVSSVSPVAVTEGGNLVHTVILSNASSTATSLTYNLVGVSATAGTDYNTAPTFSNGVTLAGGVLTVPAGVTSFTVTVASIADTIDEANETYNLTVGSVTAVGTINDDDNAPALTVGNITVNETAGFAVFSVGLSNPSSSAVTVGLSFANGTATGGTGTGTGNTNTDYGNNTRMEVSNDGGATWSALGTNSATFAAGQTTVLVRTYVNNNTPTTPVDAATETFTLTATRTAGTTSNASAFGTGTIIEQDISITSATIAEGTGAGTTTGVLTVSVNPAFTASTTVPFTLSGTALSPADYGTLVFSGGVTLSGGSLTIPSGVTSFTISVPVVRDALDEAAETVSVNIAGSTGTLTITDDDNTPTLAINDVTVNEGAGTATFTVTLSAASGQAVTVNYGLIGQTALSGADFTAVAGTLTFAPGTTTQTITVPILQDNVFEGSETFRVNLSAPVNATIADGVGIGTIADNGTGAGGTDNDTPTLAVSSITVSDQSNGFATFVVSLSNPSTTATSVSLALANGTAIGGGVDYGSATATNLQVSTDNGVTWTNATTATIAANSSYVLVRTPIIGDVANEISETFTLTATRTAGTTINASASGIGTITDIYNGPDAINDAPSAMLQEDTPAQTVLAGNVIQGGAGNVADTDPNNDTLRVTGAAAGNSLVTGSVALGSPLTVSGIYGNLVIQADGTYTYTLDNARIQTQNMLGGQVYNDVFSYRVTDGNGGYDTATITVQATGTLDLTAITPQPVAIAADGLSGEYYGYNDTVVAGNRVHADDGTATSLGTGANLESVEDITAIINGRNATMGGPNNIVGSNLAGAANAADVLFNVRTLNYGTTPVVNSSLGSNSGLAAGNALPPQDNNSSSTTTALANFLDQDAATARAQTGTPTGTAVGTQTGLGTTTDAIVRMTGFVYLERGNYDFRVTGDDGFRLRVGGETLIEFDGNQPPTTRTFSNVEVNDRISGLTSIELLYWEQGGNANLQFEFRPSDSTTWVPFSLDSIAFFSTANAPTLTDTRIQDIVETNVNQQYELRTGSVLDGDANTNTLTGAEGRDYVQGFGGDDILNGNGSADYLDGGIGNDVLNGGDGNDILVGGTGNDTMTGGTGDDIYRIDGAGDVVVEVAGAGQGTDTVEIEASYNVGTYAIGANIENALLLGAFNNNVTGNSANNRITGNDGNNILIGGAGDDRILGGRGNDTLSGDAGPLAGGNVGKDIFEWNLADRGTGGAPAIDRITDFTYSGSTTSSAVPSGDLTPQHTDALDLRDLLSGESSTSLNTGATPNIGNLLNYIDISVSGGDTSIRISSTGGFTGGTYAAGQEDQRIVLTGVDLFGVTGTTTESDLLQRLIANGTLVVD
jgi:VCBS repeat-containing protein